MTSRRDREWNIPASTPEGRRDQLARELTDDAESRPMLPATPMAGLRRAEKRRAQWLAFVRLAQRHPGEYRTLLAEEVEAAQRRAGMVEPTWSR